MTSMKPTPLPAALRMRMLRAMEEAGQETRDELDMECTLARLQPAPLPAALRSSCHTRMRHAQQSSVYRPYTRLSWWRMTAVASVIIMGVVGMGASIHGMMGGDAAQGLARRSVLERTGGNRVQWAADGDAVLEYEVMYEDSFVLSGEDDTTLVIRVPNRTTVNVKGEVI